MSIKTAQEEKKTVNINIEVPDEIHKRVKILSAMQDISLKDLIIKTLEENIDEKK